MRYTQTQTILGPDVLKTEIVERSMLVTTFLRPQRVAAAHPPWSAVWTMPTWELVWLYFWHGTTSPGGLEEAHESVVARVVAGNVPTIWERASPPPPVAPKEQQNEQASALAPRATRPMDHPVL